MRSISTIKTPVCPATRNLISESALAPTEKQGQAALYSCANVAALIDGRSKPAHQPPGVVVLTSLKSREPLGRLDALSTKLIELGESMGGIVGPSGAPPSSDPISRCCAARSK